MHKAINLVVLFNFVANFANIWCTNSNVPNAIEFNQQPNQEPENQSSIIKQQMHPDKTMMSLPLKKRIKMSDLDTISNGDDERMRAQLENLLTNDQNDVKKWDFDLNIDWEIEKNLEYRSESEGKSEPNNVNSDPKATNDIEWEETEKGAVILPNQIKHQIETNFSKSELSAPSNSDPCDRIDASIDQKIRTEQPNSAHAESEQLSSFNQNDSSNLDNRRNNEQTITKLADSEPIHQDFYPKSPKSEQPNLPNSASQQSKSFLVEKVVKRVIMESIHILGVPVTNFSFLNRDSAPSMVLSRNMNVLHMDELVSQIASSTRAEGFSTKSFASMLRNVLPKDRYGLLVNSILVEIEQETGQFREQVQSLELIITQILELLFTYMRLYRKLHSMLLNGAETVESRKAVSFSKWLSIMVDKIGNKLISVANQNRCHLAARWVTDLEHLEDTLELIDLALLITLPKTESVNKAIAEAGGRPTNAKQLAEQFDRKALIGRFGEVWMNPWAYSEDRQKLSNLRKMAGRSMINEKTATKLGTVFKRSMDKLFRYHPRWHWQHREESAYQPPMNDNAYQPYQSQHVLPLGAMVLHKYVLEQLQRELRYENALYMTFPQKLIETRTNTMECLIHCIAMLSYGIEEQ